MLAHEIVPSIARRAVESRRQLPWLVFDKLVRTVESLAAATDAIKIGDDAVSQESAHNHGYGRYGLAPGCIQQTGTVQRTSAASGNIEAELLGRNLPRTFIHFAGWNAYPTGGAPNDAWCVPVYDAQLLSTHAREGRADNVFDDEGIDIEGLAPPGCIAATVSVWLGLSAVDGSGELPQITVRVQSCDDSRILYATPPDAQQFFPEAERTAQTAGVLQKLTVERVNVTGVPIAPGAWNRLRISLAASGVVSILGAFICQINVTEEENTG